MDTTLRDGEQTNSVSFTSEEKLAIAKKLLVDVKVNRIEVGNAGVSEGEKQAITAICDWAKQNNCIKSIEVLGFVDKNRSVDWIKSTGCKVMNLLAKGSLKHCTTQLKKTQEQHFEDIKKTIEYGLNNGFDVNVYLEDWSNGIQESKEYVFSLVKLLNELKVKRVMLPDTLGILNFDQTYDLVKLMVEMFPQTWFDYHAHNDYSLGTANSISAIKAGAKGLHVTINCMGERTGNAPLDEVAVVLKDFLNIDLGIDETQLKSISRLVEIFSGRRIADSKPITGNDVFTHTAGIHADGDKKGNLYSNRLTPERFGRKRVYALGKLSGKASLEMNLEELNIELTPEQKNEVLQKIVKLGDKKKIITKEDLPFIISDVLKTPDKTRIKIDNYEILSHKGQLPKAKITLKDNGNTYEQESEGDGGYDAFMNCLKKIDFGFPLPKLIDYIVRIPPGGRTDALVETTITWKNENMEFNTIGVDSDQVVAALKATEKMLNLMKRENNH